MKKNNLNRDLSNEVVTTGSPTVSRGKIRERAVELAIINGRTAAEVSKSDWDQASRELSGGSELDPKEALLESAPESLRWNPVAGSPGHQAIETPNEDEDAEGRSETEQMVDQGVDEAEHEQMLEAAREAAKKDRREP